MNKKKLLKVLNDLNYQLFKEKVLGEICVVGGAAMVLCFQAREATKDIDAIFEPSSIIRKAAKKVAKLNNLPVDWLNDGVKGFLPKEVLEKKLLLDLNNLKVWSPSAKYLLAMKSISARFDSNDGADVRFLINHLKLKNSKKVFNIICDYYPKKLIPPKTIFFIEEIFEE